MPVRTEEKFNIPFYHIFYNPYFIIRSGIYKGIKKYSPDLTGHLMDFGCGTKPYEHLFRKTTKYTGVDYKGGGNNYKNTKVDIYYDGHKLPILDSTFDSVLSTEVIEHIFNPDEILKEIWRVLKPDGTFLLTCPFLWPEHEQPWDYARYSSFGIKHLLKKNGFKIISQEKTGNFPLCITQLLVLYLYMFIPKVPIVKHILFLIFCFPILLLGIIFNLVAPSIMKRKDLYLNNLVLCKKL